MSLATLFGNGKSIGELTLDATFSELHEYSGQVTRHPIEDGSQISDHVTLEPFTLRMECFITNTPASILGAVGGAVSGITGDTPVSEAYAKLVEMREAREVVTVVTGLQVYSDMMIERVSIPRARGQKNSLAFSVVLVQVSIVASESVTIPPSQVGAGAAAQAQAPSAVAAGTQAASAAGEELTSSAFSFLEFIQGLIGGGD